MGGSKASDGKLEFGADVEITTSAKGFSSVPTRKGKGAISPKLGYLIEVIERYWR